jgi:SEC-C motif-containing protein
MTIPTHDNAELEAYCLPFIHGEKLPQTCAELMASRYVAYATGAIDYLIDTHDPKTRSDADRKATADWSRRAAFHGLTLLGGERGGPEDDTGTVEFIARYTIEGVEHTHHELSEFRRVEGRWYFVNGEKVANEPMRRASPKVGRNDPCPCGSGKKYKKCCAA